LGQKARSVRAALVAKGFREVSRHHYFYFFHYRGKKSHIHTKISHGATDISQSLCGLMAKQIKLTNPQFQQFVDCPLTEEMYADILVRGQHITR
jgi:hypothetical protein